MRVFDHREDGTSEGHWAASQLAELPQLPPFLADAVVLVLAAHPDDESLGAGGLISDAAARGARIRVLLATDGEASHPNSPTHSAAQLAGRRRDEVAEAVAALAPGIKIEFLGWPDGRLADHADVLVSAIAERIDGCTHVITPWCGDRHPDHEACALAARRALTDRPEVEHWQYPIWAWHWALDSRDDDNALPWSDLRRLVVTEAAQRAKRTALACHRSQHAPLSAAPGDEAILSPSVLAHFTRSYETFVVERRAPAAAASYFAALYDADRDPWGLGQRFYERRKRDLLLASLPRDRFVRAFEPGCATGEITLELARRCDAVVAWDGARRAVHQTRRRVPTAVVERRRIPHDWPDGAFDLIVLSEIGYYCSDLDELARRVRASLAADGVIVACHWNHDAPDHPHDAPSVHAALGSGLARIATHREADFLLDVWAVRAESVAQREGIVP